jgi:hypothetical protein
MRRSTVLASVLLAVSSAACAQETVLLRLGGQVGQSSRYRSVMATFMRSPQMAAMMSSDTTLPFMRMTMSMTRVLNARAGDTLTFVEVIDSAAVETPAAPQMSGMMGAVAGQMQGQTTTQRTDSRGRIYSSEVSGGMAAMAGMGGGGRGGAGGGGNQRPLYLLPERAVRVGETWTDTMVTPAASPGEGPSTFAATFRLERVEQHGASRVAVVSLNGTQTMAAQQGPQTFNLTGEFQLDLAGRRLASATLTMRGIVKSRDGEIPVRMEMTQSLTP